MQRRKHMHKKSNSFNWYGLSQRFSIRKYHFGAASVLLGTALVFGNGATAHASEPEQTETPAAVVPAEKTEDATETPAPAENTPAASTEVPVATESEKAASTETPAEETVETPAPASTETPAAEDAPKTRTRRSVDTEQQPPVAAPAPTANSVDTADGEDVNGLTVTAKGEVKDTTNDGKPSEEPKVTLSMDIRIPVGKYKVGDTLDIRFENLFAGVSLDPVMQLVSTDKQYIYADLVSRTGTLSPDTTVGVNTQKGTAANMASSDKTTLADKLAANIPFQGADVTYTYKFNSNVEALENMRLYFEVTNADVALPAVNEAKSLVGKAYVDGVEVLTLPYTKAAETSIDGTSGPMEVDNWGVIYLNKDKTINRMETTVALRMGENALPTGGTFDVTLNDTEFSKFVSTGPTTPFAISATRYPMVANENGVYLNTMGGIAPKVQVVSVTDNKVTYKVVEGELSANTAYNFYLQGNNPDKGARRIFTNKTQELLKAAIEAGRPSIGTSQNETVDATISATGLTAADGTPSLDTTGPVGWGIRYPQGGFTEGNERTHTAELLLRIVTEDTGAEIFGPTPIVDTTEGILSGTVINKDRFASTAPTANTTIVREADLKNYKPDTTENGGVKTVNVTAPYIVEGPKPGSITDANPAGQKMLFQFVGYAPSSLFENTKLADVLVPETANLVAQYKELAFGRVNVKYLDLRGNELKPTATTSYKGYNAANPNFDHVVGKDYDVTGEAPVTTRPETIEKDGYTYILVKEPTNLKGQLAADTIFAEYYYDVAQKANVTFTKQEDKSNLGNVAEQGLATTAISPAQYAAKLKELVAQGYEVVTDGFGTSTGTTVKETTDKTFDNDAAVDQAFEVVLKERVIDVTNPNDPNVPQEVKDTLKLTEQVTQTITYVYEKDGSKAADTDTTTVDFTRTAKVNLVTKEVTYTPWVATTFDAVPSPEIAGYTPDKLEIAETPVNAEDTDAQHTHVVTYKADDQIAIITFEKQEDKSNLGSVTENGKSSEKISGTVYAAKVADLIKQGYEVVSDEFGTSTGVTVGTSDKAFDKDAKVNQEFKVVVKERVVPIKPDAKPGEPVDPNDPNSPNWPDNIKDVLDKEEVVRTISYVNDKDETVSPNVEQKVGFHRPKTVNLVNLVTAVITEGEWTADTTDSFEEVKSPVITGYLADRATVETVAGVKATDADITEKVVYKPVGKYIIEEPGKPASETPYANDPQDPTQLDPNGKPNVPFVEGYTPKDENGNDLPPVDPNDPKQGYVAPPVPTDPGKDTPIRYVIDKQKANIVFVKDGNKDATVTETGDSATAIPTTAYETKLAEYKAQGYDVQSDNFATSDKTFDKDAKVDQDFEVVLVPKVVPVTPGAKPGEPVDPSNPNGPKWPAGVDQLVTKEEVNQTVKYVKEDGTEAAPTVTDKVEFTREAEVNLVTGEVKYGEWTAVNTDTTFDVKKSPVVPGYVADKEEVPAKEGITATDADVEEVVTYKSNEQVAKIVFVKDGNEDATVTEKGESGSGISTTGYTTKLEEYIAKGYEVQTDEFKDADKTFDKDSTKDQEFKVVLVAKTVPVTPGAKPGEPVDPNNPNGPKWPAGVDQLVTKEVVNQTVKYVKSTDGSEAAPTVTDKVEFTRDAEVNLVTGEVKYGNWTAVNGDTTFDVKKSPVVTGFLADKAEIAEKSGLTATDADVEEVVTYSPIGGFVIEIPGQDPIVVPYPNDPNDPTKPGVPTTVIPYVPGFIPVGPDGNPLTPVDPQDPTKGYNPPTPTGPGTDTPITFVPIEQEVPGDFPTVDLPELEIPVTPQGGTTETPVPVTEKPSTPSTPSTVSTTEKGILPKTGEEQVSANAGFAFMLGALGLAGLRRRKKEEN